MEKLEEQRELHLNEERRRRRHYLMERLSEDEELVREAETRRAVSEQGREERPERDRS